MIANAGFVVGLILSSAVAVAMLDAANASPITMSGTGAGLHAVYVTGSYGSFFINDSAGASADIVAAVDAAGPSLTYASEQFATVSLTRQFTQSFTVGLGNSVNVTLDLTIDPISVSQLGIGPLALTPATGGTYTVSQGPYPSNWTFTMMGSYKLTGPTQTVSGTFSKDRTIYQFNGGTLYPRWDFDSTGFPDAASLTGRQLVSWNSFDAPYLIDAVVDGAHITLTSGGEYWDYTSPLALSAPEPSIGALVVLLGFLCGAGRRRTDGRASAANRAGR